MGHPTILSQRREGMGHAPTIYSTHDKKRVRMVSHGADSPHYIPERGTRIMPAIEFEKETIGHILHSRKNLQVPINQRSYAWKREHVEDLYKDLNGAITERQEEYFLGAIVVVSDGGGKALHIYDGQQRLATSMILIGAIRDFFYRSGDKRTAETIANESLRSITRKTLQPETHFGLSADDNEFFVNTILRYPEDAERKQAKPDGKKESHRLILDPADLTKRHVEDLTVNLQPEQKTRLLHEWLDFLDTGARVIWVEVKDERTAFKIFETMNDRGLKLSAADLLKNYLYSLGQNKKQVIVQKWQGMSAVLESLGPDYGDIVNYIRYYWIMKHGHTRTNVLFDRIKLEINNEANAVSWATELELQAHNYVALYSSSHDAWNGYHPEIRSNVETLRFLGVSQVRPMLLAAFTKFSKKEMEKLLKAAVNWSVRVLLSGVPSGTLEGHYSKMAKKIADGEIARVDELTKELLVIIPGDDRFRGAVATASVPDAQFARYYFRVLQIQADGTKEQCVPNSGKPVTLEHILPLKPGSEWAHIAPEDAKANCNRLGNLALLDGDSNSTIGNVGYDTKKPALQSSPFSLTQEAALYPAWSLNEIAKRQERLAELAVLAWSIKIR